MYPTLKSALTEETLLSRIESVGRSGYPRYESIYEPELRAQTIALHSRDALGRGGGRVCQRGAMSSFSLPTEPPDAPIWFARDGKVKRSPFLHKQQHDERATLSLLAAKHGCSLILDPSVPLKKYGPAARKIRLRTLLAFVKDERACPDLRVAFQARNTSGNLLVVGDWFCGESVTPEEGFGYRHTLFTWHAPTVLARLSQFQQELEAAEVSRGEAAARIETEIGRIP